MTNDTKHWERKIKFNIKLKILKTMVLACVLPASFAHASPYVVLDTGHTLNRPGAMGADGQVEYQYNLNMSTAVAAHLQHAGVRLLRVAADGRDIELKNRATQAPDADVFISIHHDSMPQEWIDEGRNKLLSGFSLLVSKKNPRFEESLACARVIGERLLAAQEKPSLYHAVPTVGENLPLLDARLGIHQYDNLVVLKTAAMPAVLIEVGVIVNPNEAVRLKSSATIKKVSQAIAQGIQGCVTQ